MEKPGAGGTGFQADDGLTGNKNKGNGDPNHLRLCQGFATPHVYLPSPDSSKAPGMQHHLQQLRVPWFLDHDQWRMIEARDGKFPDRGSRI